MNRPRVDQVKLRLGRPDISRYADRFAVPAATSHSRLRVTFLGVATLLIDDGTSAIMTDGFFSRPSLLRVATTALSPDRARITSALERAGVTRLGAVLPVHSHYDHAKDSAVVAALTDAVLIGGESTLNIGRGGDLAEDRLVLARSGGSLRIGPYEITHIASEHCPPDRFPGVIDEPLRPPASVKAYLCGEAWSITVEHAPSGQRMLIQGSAGFVPGALAQQRADVVYLGVGQLGLRPEAEIRRYWAETVELVGARRVVLIHWDDFFRPLTRPLRAAPFLGDDLDTTMRIFDELSAQSGIEVLLPTPWQPSDPWSWPSGPTA